MAISGESDLSHNSGSLRLESTTPEAPEVEEVDAEEQLKQKQYEVAEAAAAAEAATGFLQVLVFLWFGGCSWCLFFFLDVPGMSQVSLFSCTH